MLGLGGPGPAGHSALGLTKLPAPCQLPWTHLPGPSLLPSDWSRCFQSPQPHRICAESPHSAY